MREEPGAELRAEVRARGDVAQERGARLMGGGFHATTKGDGKNRKNARNGTYISHSSPPSHRALPTYTAPPPRATNNPASVFVPLRVIRWPMPPPKTLHTSPLTPE